MQKEDFTFFKDLNNVRIELNEGFFLYGSILRVSDDAIVFKTEQKTSIIRMVNIRSVVEW